MPLAPSGLRSRTPFTANLYEDLARFYDPVHVSRPYEQEVEFALSLLDSHGTSGGRRALDVFCGTGGHSIPAARRGLDVTGVDTSGHMLVIARTKARAANVAARFEPADCRALPYIRRFDLIFGLGQSIQYLTTYHDIRRALSGVRAALRPGGVCVFDLINGARMVEPYRAAYDDTLEDGTKVQRTVTSEPDREHRIVVSTSDWLIELPDGRVLRDHTVERYRILLLDEVELLFDMSQLDILSVYDDRRSCRPDLHESVSLTVLARRRAGARACVAFH